RPPCSPLFPYTTLFRSELRLHLVASEATPDENLSGLGAALLIGNPPWPPGWEVHRLAPERIGPVLSPRHPSHHRLQGAPAEALRDRKSTRLNSSHVKIS